VRNLHKNFYATVIIIIIIISGKVKGLERKVLGAEAKYFGLKVKPRAYVVGCSGNL